MVKAIGSYYSPEHKVQTIRERTIDDGKKGLAVGAVFGAIEGYTRKSWLTKGEPSDKFIKTVSFNMSKELPKDEHNEFEKVRNFFKALVDYKSELPELRTRIEESKELTNAVDKKEGETVKDALDRIFSQDKMKVKHDLRNLQDRTVVDKKVDLQAAKKLVNANFDKKAGALKKADGTSKEMFAVLKKSARSIKLGTAVSHTMAAAVVAGTAGLLIGTRHMSKES